MSDKAFVVEIPEDLLNRAQAAHVDVRRVLIDALEQEVRRLQIDQPVSPSREEVEAAVQESLRRVASGQGDFRVLGLHAGTSWVSDDFDDPLPDEFWLGGNP